MDNICPYEYVTEQNFDIVRGCIMQGMTFQKPPHEIVNDLKKVTDIPEYAIKAIVGQELGTSFDVWQKRKQ